MKEENENLKKMKIDLENTIEIKTNELNNIKE
jgi:hypothetical protein